MMTIVKNNQFYIVKLLKEYIGNILQQKNDRLVVGDCLWISTCIAHVGAAGRHVAYCV